jgi:hypothetical protein
MSSIEDKIVSETIDKTEEKLDKCGKSPKKKDNMFVRFIVSLFWFFILFIINIVVLGLGTMGFLHDFSEALASGVFHDSRTLEICGIVLSGLFALITFLVPYLRRKGSFTKWLGIISIFDVIWYAYLIITNG